MTGIDTNLLVRYLTRDDEDQYRRAKALLESECTQAQPGYVNVVVLCEVVWVLKAVYGASRDELAEVLDRMLAARQLQIAHRDAVVSAVQDFRDSAAEFSECLIGRLNREAGCDDTATFDAVAGRLSTFRPV